MRWLVLALCACTRLAPSEPLRNESAVRSGLVEIASVAPLALAKPGDAAVDCRPSERVRERFAGRDVIPCGTLALDADRAAHAAAGACVERALADEQPFLLEVQLPGIDSQVARGFVAVVEREAISGYQVFYDSDPCGGSCPDRGMTTIERCTRITRDPANAEACAIDATQCFRCESARPIELCRFGRR